MFKEEILYSKILSLSDILELRDNNIKIRNVDPMIYHSELNILVKWRYQEKQKLKKMNKKYSIESVSYHLATRYKENHIENDAFVGIGTPLSRSQMKKNIKENIKVSRNIFGKKTRILVENNNHLLTNAYDVITDADFIKEVVEENNIFLLLDISHAEMTAYNKKIDFKEYIQKLPMKRCLQIHLSRYIVRNEIAIDSHEELQTDNWSNFKNIAETTNILKYVTIEYYKDGNKLLHQLNILRKIQQEAC